VVSDTEGVFAFIPSERLEAGVYDITARATDAYGAVSEPSDPIRIAVSEPGYLRLGGFLINVLSVVIPLVALVVLLVMLVWYLLAARRRFRGTVGRESQEALEILAREFSSLQEVVRAHEADMITSRKTGKLTKAEEEMVRAFDESLQAAQKRVEKEISDVAMLVTKNTKRSVTNTSSNLDNPV